MSQFHVDQIRTHLRNQYEEAHWIRERNEVNNLSRILALHALKPDARYNESDSLLIDEITDGGDDLGIDAVSVNSSLGTVTFVQSKWRQNGTGSMDLGEVLRFLNGVRSLIGMPGEQNLIHASEETRKAVNSLLQTPGTKLRLIAATTARDPLSAAVKQPILDLLCQINDLDGADPIATHTHLGQAEFFSALTEPLRSRVDLEIQIQDWGRVVEPINAYYGRVNAVEIAQWHKDHGDDLFSENIRVVIPRSDINEGILNTIREEPQHFGYYNNGITILCEDIAMSPAGILNRETGLFRLSSASIINGAQTVSTLGSILGTSFEANLSKAFVIVRCVKVPPGDPMLGRQITRFANTQNEVSSQDFTFLDPVQHRLAQELQVLGYEYILRSSETPRSENPSKVIEVRTAAISLACASSNISHAIVAKREVSRLFADKSIYKSLFNPKTEALRLVNSVHIVRHIDWLLQLVAESFSGIISGVAIHARRIIAHQILRQIGDSRLESSSTDPELLIKEIGPMIASELNELVRVFPENSYPGNVFKNQERTLELISLLQTSKKPEM